VIVNGFFGLTTLTKLSVLVLGRLQS